MPDGSRSLPRPLLDHLPAPLAAAWTRAARHRPAGGASSRLPWWAAYAVGSLAVLLLALPALLASR